MKAKRPYADLILIGALLLAGAVLGLVLLLTRSDGAQVQVRVDGAIEETFSLNEDRTYRISGAEDGTNLLIIEDGTARIEEASCPDGLCVNMGRISRDGQSIICLPNKVVVEVIGGNSEEEPSDVDVVAGGRS